MIREGIDSKSPEKTANLIFGSLIGCAALNIHHNMQSELDVEGFVEMIFSALQSKGR